MGTPGLNMEQFLGYIYCTPCGNCPISEYCAVCKALSCTSTAKRFFRDHNEGGIILWQKLVTLRLDQRTIHQND